MIALEKIRKKYMWLQNDDQDRIILPSPWGTLFLQGKQYPVAIGRPSLPFYPSYYVADSHNAWENDTVKIVQSIF